MKKHQALTLENNDPRVQAALKAEKNLYTFYGLEPKTHILPLAQYGNIRIRICEFGSGRPVLVVPGNTGDVFPFVPLLAELQGLRILAVNRPGGGLSEGINHLQVDFRKLAFDTLTAVLDFFKLEKAPLIAHSIGGHWSLWMAMEKPERVSSLALLGMPGNIVSTSPPFALRLLSIPGLNRLLYNLILSGSPDKSFKSLSFMGHSAETCARLPQALADCYYSFPRLPHYKTASLSLIQKVNCLSGSRAEVLITAEELKQLLQPALFLWGEHDPFGSQETGRQIAAFLPQADFHALQNAGHLPWLDHPAECGRLIREFLAKKRVEQ